MTYKEQWIQEHPEGTFSPVNDCPKDSDGYEVSCPHGLTCVECWDRDISGDQKEEPTTEKCPWSDRCRNGGDCCWSREPKNCVRFMPTEGTNTTVIDGIVETPPGIDCDKFSQYFMNWIDMMGWSFCGSFNKWDEDKV